MNKCLWSRHGDNKGCPVWSLADGQLIRAQRSTQLLWQCLSPLPQDEWLEITRIATEELYDYQRNGYYLSFRLKTVLFQWRENSANFFLYLRKNNIK